METRRINDEVICVLRKGDGGRIVIDFEDIAYPFQGTLLDIKDLCSDSSSSLTEIIRFIREEPAFVEWKGSYKYCEKLHGAYQGVEANPTDLIEEVQVQYDLARENFEGNQDGTELGNQDSAELDQRIERIKNKVLSTVSVWNKAHALELAYKSCQTKEGVLSFSHRERGWSNPRYDLTENFSIEIKTNFGYGSATYFYTKITFKGVEIVPFSDWVTYHFARFHEIVRYSKKHSPENKSWLEAMTYARNACNMTLIDEELFVKRYIVQECETMVSRLEEFLEMDDISIRRNDTTEPYKLDKRGRVLIVFRGEKISGALDFISKILEFEKIVAIREFIQRIEECNKRLHPILVTEAAILREKVIELEQEKAKKKPRFDSLNAQNDAYDEKLLELRKKLVDRGMPEDWELPKKLAEAFKIENPEYEEFEEEFDLYCEQYNLLCQDLRNHVDLRDKVSSYQAKIDAYFS